jgi:hypothetical protein
LIKKSNSLYIAIWLLALVPPLTIAVVELNKTILIWHIRIVDFVDLVFLAPFYLFVLLKIQSEVFYNKKTFAFWLGLGVLSVFIYGHAMHLTGNAINTYSTEIHDYRMQIPIDTYELIYFFDENLGHWLIFAGLFGLMGIWLFEDALEDKRFWLTAMPAIIIGLFQSISIIESSHPWLGLVALVFLTTILVIRLITHRENLIEILHKRPLARFVVIVILAILIGELIYFFVMGGFIQPSQI